jgi:hypothetical protein
MSADESVAESSEPAPCVDDVYQFLLGATAVGVGLGFLLPLVRTGSSAIPNFVTVFPTWAWFLGAAAFLGSAFKATSIRARLVDGLMAALLAIAPFAARLPDSRIVSLAEFLFLGGWGTVTVFRLGPRMPVGLARSGLALGIALASASVLPIRWKWAALSVIVLVVLVAVWILDNLEADGVIRGHQARSADDSPSHLTRE